MDLDSVQEFNSGSTLINRFNAWREATLGLPPVAEPLPAELVEHYRPVPASVTLEEALREQIAWITAWRIDRYAFASLKQTAFYNAATDTEADSTARKQAEAERDSKQAAIEKRRRLQLHNQRFSTTPAMPFEPGFRDFDPDMAQTQLREAAEDFREDYHFNTFKVVALWAVQIVLSRTAALDQVRTEHRRIKADGQARIARLFPQPLYGDAYPNEHTRGQIDEKRNANLPEGLLRAMFDDQVHDSRAWFLHAALGFREPGGSYLRERMVFFGNAHSREVTLYDQNAKPVTASAVGLPEAAPAQRGPLSAEEFAEARKKIDAHWAAKAQQDGGVNDASA